MTRRSCSSSSAPARRDRRRRAGAARVGAGAEASTPEKFDSAGSSRQYGEHQVSTGPYMIENDESRQDHRLHAGHRDQARPQPELGRVDGLQAGLPGLDHDQGGQRRPRSPRARSWRATRWCRATSSCPAADPLAASRAATRRIRWMHDARRPGRFRYIAVRTDRSSRSTTRTCARALNAAIDKNALRQGVRRPDHRRDPDALDPAGPARLRGGRRRRGSGRGLHGQARGRPRAGEGVHEEGRLRVGHVRRRQDVHRRLRQRDAAEEGRRRSPWRSSRSSASRST